MALSCISSDIISYWSKIVIHPHPHPHPHPYLHFLLCHMAYCIEYAKHRSQYKLTTTK